MPFHWLLLLLLLILMRWYFRVLFSKPPCRICVRIRMFFMLIMLLFSTFAGLQEHNINVDEEDTKVYFSWNK